MKNDETVKMTNIALYSPKTVKLENRDFSAVKTIQKQTKTVSFALPLKVKTSHFRQFSKTADFEKLHKVILWKCQKEYFGTVKRNTSLLLDGFMIRTVFAPSARTVGESNWRTFFETTLRLNPHGTILKGFPHGTLAARLGGSASLRLDVLGCGPDARCSRVDAFWRGFEFPVLVYMAGLRNASGCDLRAMNFYVLTNYDFPKMPIKLHQIVFQS